MRVDLVAAEDGPREVCSVGGISEAPRVTLIGYVNEQIALLSLPYGVSLPLR
jgi:hypothetical protein